MSRPGVGSFVLVSAVFAACGGGTSTVGGDTDAGAPTRDGGGSSGTVDSGGSSSGSSGMSSGGVFTGEAALIVHRFFLGETTRSGTAASTAWKDYGRNVDGLTTTINSATSPDLALVCKRKAGAAATVHNDGVGGIDNNWGSQIMKLLSPFEPTPSKGWSDEVAGGARTAMISVSGKDGFFVFAEKTATTPTFAPTEKRDIAAAWMNGTTPRALITAGGMTNGIYDSGAIAGEVLVGLGPNLTVPLRAVHVSMKIDATGASATDGVISGVVETEVLVAALETYAHTLSPELCAGSTIEGIKDSVRQASDILKDGTQDPNKECDGISVGIGFEAKAVTVGDVAPAPQPTPDPCQ